MTLLVFVAAPSLVMAQEEPQVPDPEEYMRAYTEATTPGPEHAFLAGLAGTWTYENKMYMPGSPQPILSSGKTVMEMVMGGRYLYAVHEGSMNNERFEGRSFTAYDRTAGAYFATWADNVGLGIMVFQGQRNAEGALDLTASYTDPVMGELQTHRMVQYLAASGELMMEYFISSEGMETYKAMEVKYTRDE